MIGAVADPLPPVEDSVAFAVSLPTPSVAERLARAASSGEVLLQPRCGVGDHVGMLALLRRLEAEGEADVLSVTIDSHTRLGRFDVADAVRRRDPGDLNGYPLVSHGWRRGRELALATGRPLEVRHGSPVAERLFATSVASGITSFEGGGISYNVPYAKDVPLRRSLESWQRVDRTCGELAEQGLVVDRELFGTLTAVLVPPAISLAVSVLEAVLAARAGVRCVSVAYPQSGHALQDVAALRAIPVLAERYVPGVVVHPVLHQFMGQFPRVREHAARVIVEGAVVGRLGGARKIVVKSVDEAHGRPGPAALVEGLRLARQGLAVPADPAGADDAEVATELGHVVREVGELVDDLVGATDLVGAVVDAAADGRLDVPFSPSTSCAGAVLPARDERGGVWIRDFGRLPVSAQTRARHAEALRSSSAVGAVSTLVDRDVHYLLDRFGETRESVSIVSFGPADRGRPLPVTGA